MINHGLPMSPFTVTSIAVRRTSAMRYCFVAALVALAACSKGASSDSAGSGAAAGTSGSDSTGGAQEIALSSAQLARVRTMLVSLTPFRSEVHTTGTVAFNGDKSTQVLAPVSGPITRIMVNPGSYVRKGEALATVTSPDFATATAAFRKAQSAFRNAQRIADLDAQLFKNDAISRREVDQAATDAAAAAADRDAAIQQMRALGVDAASISAIRENQASPSAASAVIRAPIEGTVVEKLVTPGQLIQAGTTPAFTIADLSSVWVLANVFETDLAQVSSGEAATVTTGASRAALPGQVTYVGALVDPASKATAVRVLVPNSRGLLKRDMLVNVAIRAAQSRNARLIPVGALLRDDQNLPFVYVASPNGRFARRQVRIGARSGDQYEVTSGLSDGDRIVIDGALFLQFAGSQ